MIFDIEADGLLNASGNPDSPSYKKAATQFWCIAAVDVDTGEEFYWGKDQELPEEPEWVAKGPYRKIGWINSALEFLGSCDLLLGHNAIGFDFPVSEKLYGWTRPAKSHDTLTYAKLIWPVDVLADKDFALARQGRMPMKYVKRHSLAAWGYRTGTYKGDYEGGFHEWSPAMAEYLIGDIRATRALWGLIEKKLASGLYPERTIEVEMFMARLMQEQEAYGVQFDMKAALELERELKNQKARLEADLVRTFGSWWQPEMEVVQIKGEPKRVMVVTTPAADRAVTLTGEPNVILPRLSEKTGKRLADYVGPPKCHYTKTAPFTNIERITFSPANRGHLGMRLQDVFGWEPKAFGKNGMATVDEGTLEAIPEGVMPAEVRRTILDAFIVNKTLAMLATGPKAWIKLAAVENLPAEAYRGTSETAFHRLHGQCDPLGTITRRGAHNNPNLGQVPKGKTETIDAAKVVIRGLRGKYGEECRTLFIANTSGKLTAQTGIDASSLELIDLGHYLHRLDEGAFSARVCDPDRDAHQEHAAICAVERDDAKTTIYLFVYGGSAYKLSLEQAIKVPQDAVPKLLGYRGLPMILKSLEKRLGENFVKNLDDMQKARIAHCRVLIVKLGEGITGLNDLKESVTQAAERGWLKAIDGSKVHVRKSHAALNTLLQSAGAISCKIWQLLFHQEMGRRGYVLWRDYAQVLWVHDEIQIIHPPGMGAEVAEVGEWALVEAGKELGLNGRYRTGAKHGRNWAECH